jgi:hypothetical protein
MELRKPDISDRIALIKLYQQKTLNELQSIKPSWAYGENTDKILDYSLHPINQKYTIFHVDPAKLITSSELYEVSTETLFNGQLLNDSRIAGILYRWDRNEFVDPPTVGLSMNFKGKLSLSDGRHRAKLSFLLGHKQIPVAIHKTEITEVSNIIQLIKIQE